MSMAGVAGVVRPLCVLVFMLDVSGADFGSGQQNDDSSDIGTDDGTDMGSGVGTVMGRGDETGIESYSSQMADNNMYNMYDYGNGNIIGSVDDQLNLECLETTAVANITVGEEEEDIVVQYWYSLGENKTKKVQWMEDQAEGSGESPGLNICGGEFSHYLCHSKETQEILSGLYPAHHYTFCLNNGTGHHIVCKECLTGSTAPLKNPELTSIDAGLDFIEIKWIELDKKETGGTGLMYKVVLESINDKHEVKTNSTRARFPDLNPGTNFTIILSAENKIGESRIEKQTKDTRTLELLAPDVVSVEHDWHNETLTATIKWQFDEATANLCSKLTGSCGTIIQLWQLNGINSTQTGEDIVTEKLQKSYLLSNGFESPEGLTRNTFFTLKIFYSTFFSSETQHRRLFDYVTTPLSHPTVIQQLVGQTFITLEWRGLSREEQGGPGLFYKTVIMREDFEKIEDSTTNNSYSFANLKPGTSYSIEVSAGNIIGMCEAASDNLKLTTLELLAPDGVTVNHQWTNDSVVADVSWDNQHSKQTNITQWSGTIIQLWNLQTLEKTLIETHKLPHNQTHKRFELTNERNEDTFYTLKTCNGNYESNNTELTKLFDGITVPLVQPNISVTDIGFTFIMVVWSELSRDEQGAPGLLYKVRCTGNEQQLEVLTSKTSRLITDLKPGSDYTITVNAENMIGESRDTVYNQQVRTKELLAPHDVTVRKEWINQSLVAIVGWENKELGNINITQDLVFGTVIQLWRQTNLNTTLMETLHLPPSQTEKTFELTKKFSQDTFFTLKTVYGEHDSNNTEFTKLFDGITVPSIQPNISITDVGFTFIMIEWSGLSREEQIAPGLSYNVKCNGNRQQFEIRTSNTSQLVSHLKPGTEYSIAVTAKNIMGESYAPVIKEYATTHLLLPPLDITLEKGVNGIATVSWRILSHNVSNECSQSGAFLDLWKQKQGEYFVVESHQVESNQLQKELWLKGDLDYGVMLSLKSYCGDHNSSRTQRIRLFDLEPPSNITVDHVWNHNILTASICWQIPADENIEQNPDRGGFIIELWNTNETNYTLLDRQLIGQNITQLSFNMSDELDQRTMFRLITYYQDNQSPGTNLTELFYDVSLEATNALIERMGLIAGVSLLVVAFFILLVCQLVKNCERKSYDIKAARKYKECKDTEMSTFITATGCQETIPVKETLDGGYVSLTGSTASLSVVDDEMWFLYSGMDEDGSFIGDATYATIADNLDWREANSGEPL